MCIRDRYYPSFERPPGSLALRRPGLLLNHPLTPQKETSNNQQYLTYITSNINPTHTSHQHITNRHKLVIRIPKLRNTGIKSVTVPTSDRAIPHPANATRYTPVSYTHLDVYKRQQSFLQYRQNSLCHRLGTPRFQWPSFSKAQVVHQTLIGVPTLLPHALQLILVAICWKNQQH